MATTQTRAGSHVFAAKGWRKTLIRFGVPVFGLYLGTLAAFDYAMHQSPEKFSKVMMHVGPAPFLLFPFETMWKSARSGHLQTGDQAPDFTLPKLDRSGSVTLSALRGQRPVVLIFGSYT